MIAMRVWKLIAVIGLSTSLLVGFLFVDVQAQPVQYRLSGTVFRDINQNSIFDAAEMADSSNYLSGWIINAFDTQGSLIESTTTNNGSFSLTLSVFEAVICIDLQSGWVQTLPVSGPVEPVDNDSYCYDFNADQEIEEFLFGVLENEQVEAEETGNIITPKEPEEIVIFL